MTASNIINVSQAVRDTDFTAVQAFKLSEYTINSTITGYDHNTSRQITINSDLPHDVSPGDKYIIY